MILCYRINSLITSDIFSSLYLSLLFHHFISFLLYQFLVQFLLILLYSANGEIYSEAVSSPASLRILDAISAEPLEEDRWVGGQIIFTYCHSLPFPSFVYSLSLLPFLVYFYW